LAADRSSVASGIDRSAAGRFPDVALACAACAWSRRGARSATCRNTGAVKSITGAKSIRATEAVATARPVPGAKSVAPA
jgi:hypothetical protein